MQLEKWEVGPDQISIELLEALGEDGVDLLHGIFSQIYESSELPDDFLTSIFIALPKKT